MATLEASGLTKRFGDRVAVEALAFRAARGEIVGFLGPNGAGKTTTFNLLSGLLAADGGTLRLDGDDVAATRRIWKHLLDLRAERGLTVLLTTHSAEEAERCDRILVLDRGRVIAEGSPDELRARVGGDVVTLGADDPSALADELKEKL